jgi:hypothetical protein
VVALASASAAFAPATPASAAPAPPFIVIPQPAAGAPASYFQIHAGPGHTTRAGVLLLRNATSRKLNLLVDPVDGLTATTLGSAYADRGSAAHGSTPWTMLSARRITLAPRGSATVAVAVAVPSGTTPGDYLSGVAIQAAGAPETQRLRSNLSISSVTRYAVGVEVMVPGPRSPRITLTGASLERRPAGLTFLLDASNRGNVILTGVTGSILVTKGSRTVASTVIGPGTFVTRSSIVYPLTAPREEPAPGTVYRLRAVMRYRGGVARLDRYLTFGFKQAVVQQHFGGPKVTSSGSVPWLVLALVALAAAALALVALVIAKRRRGRRPGSDDVRVMLERALAHASSSAPVSVILVRTDLRDESDRASRLRALVGERLRPADTLTTAPGGGLAVVAPDTGAEAAVRFAVDLREALDREFADIASGVRIGTATSERSLPAETMLASADVGNRRVARA